MGTVLGFVWSVVGCVLFNTAILVWAAVMLPNPVERARQRLERKSISTFCLGLLLTVVSVTLWAVMVNAKVGPVQLIGWLILSPTLAAAVLGGAGFCRIAAGRIQPRLKSQSEMVALVGGALATSAAGWTPVVGWFLFFPAMLMMSVGAGFLGLVSKRRVADEAEQRAAHVPHAPHIAHVPQTAPAQWPTQAPAYSSQNPYAPGGTHTQQNLDFALPTAPAASSTQVPAPQG